MLGVMLLAFAISVSAQKQDASEVTDTYYIVQSEESELALQLVNEGKKVISATKLFSESTKKEATSAFLSQYEDKSHIELIFAENIITNTDEYKGLLINRPMTVTVRYNGFYHYEKGKQRENIFVLRHAQASIILYGSRGLESNPSTNIIAPEISDKLQLLNDPNVDVRHGKVYVWIFDGDAYVENIRSYTGEELVYTPEDDDNVEDAKVNTYEFVNTAATSDKNAIGLLGKDTGAKIVKATNCHFNNAQCYSIKTGSYFLNTTVTGTLSMDCWTFTDQMWVIEDCTLNKLTTSSGRTHLTLINTTYKSLSLGSDGGGKCYALVYKHATCEKSGELLIYKNGATGPISGDSKYPDLLKTEFASQNPALGHIYVQGEINNNYCPQGLVYDTTCTRCDFVGHYEWQSFENQAPEHTYKTVSIEYPNGYLQNGNYTEKCSVDSCGHQITADTEKPLIKFLGYSVDEAGTQICSSYALDNEAAVMISELNSNFEFGVLTAVESTVGTASPLYVNESGVLSKVHEKTVKADLTAQEIKHVDIRVNASFALKYGELPLLMSAYVYDGENIFYVQSQEQESINAVSYNKIAYSGATKVIDLSTNTVALMSNYMPLTGVTLYSNTSVSQIKLVSSGSGEIYVGTAKVKDVVNARANGTELQISTEAYEVVAGENTVALNLNVGKDETVVISGTVGIYYSAGSFNEFTVINGEKSTDTLASENGTPCSLSIDVSASFNVEYPAFEGVTGVACNATVSDSVSPFVYDNRELFAGKTLTKLGIYVRTLEADVTNDQTMTLYIVDKNAKKNYLDGIKITVTVPASEFAGMNKGSINKWVYATDFKDANGNSLNGIPLSENQTLAFGTPTGDTINWGYQKTVYTDYMFTCNPGTPGNASLIFDPYLISYQTKEQRIENMLLAEEEMAAELEYQQTLAQLSAALNGKSFSILGDSISTFKGYNTDSVNTNSTIGSNAVYYTGSNCGITSVDMTWWKQASAITSMNVLVNNSWSGDRVTTKAQDRCLQLHDDTGENAGTSPDIIAVYLGINDYDNKVSYEDFAKAYDAMISKMVAKYGSADVYLFTLVPNKVRTDYAELERFNDVIREAASDYGCTVVDLYYDSGITKDNCATYMGDSQALHPNPSGMDLITDCFVNALVENYVK